MKKSKTKNIFSKVMSLIMTICIMMTFFVIPASATGAGAGAGAGTGTGTGVNLADPSTFDATESFGQLLNVVMILIGAAGILCVIVTVVKIVLQLSTEKEHRDFSKAILSGICGLVLTAIPTILVTANLLR